MPHHRLIRNLVGTALSRAQSHRWLPGEIQLVTSGRELSEAPLVDTVRGAHEWLIAVGSRSSEPTYLQEIERVVQTRPELIHYRISIGQPHFFVANEPTAVSYFLQVSHPQILIQLCKHRLESVDALNRLEVLGC